MVACQPDWPFSGSSHQLTTGKPAASFQQCSTTVSPVHLCQMVRNTTKWYGQDYLLLVTDAVSKHSNIVPWAHHRHTAGWNGDFLPGSRFSSKSWSWYSDILTQVFAQQETDWSWYNHITMTTNNGEDKHKIPCSYHRYSRYSGLIVLITTMLVSNHALQGRKILSTVLTLQVDTMFSCQWFSRWSGQPFSKQHGHPTTLCKGERTHCVLKFEFLVS